MRRLPSKMQQSRAWGGSFCFRAIWCPGFPKTQNCIMTSSTEVECRGLSQFAKENLWQRQLQIELNLFDVSVPTCVFEDNTASIVMSTNPGVPQKHSKHFGIKWAMFKEVVEIRGTTCGYSTSKTDQLFSRHFTSGGEMSYVPNELCAK